MKIRASYDPEVDSAYFRIEDSEVLDSEEVAEGIIVDRDRSDKIVAVELLGVKTIDLDSLKILRDLLPAPVSEQIHIYLEKEILVKI